MAAHGRQEAVDPDQLEATGKGVVRHGDDPMTQRPLGYASIEWIGSVEPVNAIDGDTWVNTAE